ncbi:MAG: hypothetical protein WCK86_06505 [Planctomycetia bacterium]
MPYLLGGMNWLWATPSALVSGYPDIRMDGSRAIAADAAIMGPRDGMRSTDDPGPTVAWLPGIACICDF